MSAAPSSDGRPVEDALMPGFQRAEVRTTDPELMAEATRQAFGDLALSVIDPDGPEFHLSTVVGPSMALLDFSLGFTGRGDMDQLETPPAERTYSIGRVQRGHARVWDEDQVDATRPYLYPDRFESEFADADARVIVLDRTLVRDVARDLAGDEGLEVRFISWNAIDQTHDARWQAASDYADSILRLTAAEPSSLLEQELPRLLATSLLAAFPNTLLDWLDDRPDARRPTAAAVRRAIAFIHEHAHEPMAVADIAAAAGLSARGLHNAFQREVGVPPLRYLIRVRLQGARKDLIAADPATSSVAGIARRWGFAHLGRFAQAYRTEFGEYPRDVLRQ